MDGRGMKDLWVGWNVGQFLVNFLSSAPRDVLLTFTDVSKSRAKPGCWPHIKIEQGIALFIDWFRRNES
jgi:nucleoside-diphosphate-sugar epimerase